MRFYLKAKWEGREEAKKLQSGILDIGVQLQLEICQKVGSASDDGDIWVGRGD